MNAPVPDGLRRVARPLGSAPVAGASRRRAPKVLVLSLKGGGGVEAMRRAVVGELRRGGFDVSLAWYAYYREAPHLSVPSWQLFLRAPGTEAGTSEETRSYDIGCRLPELEWCHYYPSALWRRVVEDHDHHVCVSGSVLPAWPAVASGRRCLAWVATPYYPDKTDRLRAYPLPRRVADALLDTPVCSRVERSLLGRAHVLALSAYTRGMLEGIAPGSVRGVLPMPVAPPHLAEPALEAKTGGPPWRVGFSARYEDPRKNVGLLIEAVGLCRAKRLDIELVLVGGQATAGLAALAERHGVAGRVTFGPVLAGRDLAAFYRSLDLFVVPSRQEGLGIVGLEAMAAGCPVVATRCGGPEEYVVDGENGRLVGFDAGEMADAIMAILLDPARNRRMRAAARATILSRYTEKEFREGFWSAFGETLGAREPMTAAS